MTGTKKPSDHGIYDSDTAFIVHPILPKQKKNAPDRAIEDILEEAEGLARAIALEVLETRPIKLSKITPGSFFTKGLKEETAAEIDALKPDVVIVNTELSPVQQRNLEKAWNAKIIDRTGLILEIFGARAQTKEGTIQVQLAALEYQRSRLVRSWTHLERQRGGAGFMGGPGERQIEIDRRLIAQRITRLKKDLEQVKRTRDLGRQSRERVPFPIIALAGYTNAGKSTLFNTLTKAKVFAEDLPFATLDPTMRKLKLAGGQEVILADTVGFISDLPTDLVVSFRATLEQVNYADVILHVIDVAREDYEAQRQDVINILKDLGIDYEDDPRIIEVYNKIDAVEDEDRQSDFRRHAKFNDGVVCVSATKKQGLEALLEEVVDILSAGHSLYHFDIPYSDGKALAWLHANGDVQQQDNLEETVRISVDLSVDNANKFSKSYGYQKQS